MGSLINSVDVLRRAPSDYPYQVSRIMVVEFGFGRPVDQIPPLSNENREPVPIIQAGRNMVHYLGVSKGYCPLAVTECNIIWCRGDCLES